MPKTRAEEEEEAGREIPTKCKTCGVENEEDAKFCKGCGESMATEAPEEPEEPPPSSKRPGGEERKEERAGEHPPAPERMQAPKRMDAAADLGAILLADGASPLTLKTAAIDRRAEHDLLVALTGETEHDKIIGAGLALHQRLSAAESAAAGAKRITVDAAKAKRWDLAKRLNKLGLDAWPRDMIFRDRVEGGKRVGVEYAADGIIKTMPLGQLEGMVVAHERARAKAPRNPLQPDRDKAREGARERAANEGIDNGGVPRLVDGKPTKAQIEAAKRDPTVLAMSRRPGNRFTLDQIAAEYVATAAEAGMSIGGPS